MNILQLNNSQYQKPIFRARKKENTSFEKLQFTPIEKEYNDVLLQLHSVNSNIYTQKQNLRHFYSAQDKYDYQELLKEGRKLQAKLKRIAKKYNMQANDLDFSIGVKKEYNWLAPKIFRAQTREELQKVIDFISSQSIYRKVQEMLDQLIKQKKFKK